MNYVQEARRDDQVLFSIIQYFMLKGSQRTVLLVKKDLAKWKS